MAIFQKSVIKKHLKSLDKDILENAFQIFKEKYSPVKIEKIKQLKEEEYQDGFLRDLFVDVFGYTLKPDDNYNLVREFKNQNDGRKADGAILKHDIESGEKAIAVIELKSTKSKDLKKVTEQAFGYKNNQPDCKYVIISNFQKLRFYVDYANEFEEFDLFNLQKNDFDLLYLLLNKNSIFSDIPIKLKTETKFHEQNISDKLYKDYSIFKNKLFKNLIKNNLEQDKLILFKKSQKLLDRFLFILFAEDSGLLPPNSISRIIERYRKLIELDAYKPIYDIYKQYFEYMNIGRKGKTNADNIPAYNGGLFYIDELLDNLKIDDEILINDLLKLSEYDFNTEVDVNILGHIFEHSLSEIEEITAEIQGSSTDKTKSKRKKDGVFYTPKYITQYIVENTIGTLCTEKRKELDIEEIEFDGTYRLKDSKLSAKGKKLFLKLENYNEWLKSLKIVDPACGSGAFLNQALNFLIQEHKDIDDIIAELTNTTLRIFDVEKAILENNLYGVDINEESVEIAKLSLWLRTAQKNRKLSNLNKNIKCGNSLIDDPEIAGDKAFDWNTEFPQVFKEKNKKAWHITTATHNSRYSQRMFDNHIKLGESVWISEKDEIIVAETIAGIVKDDNLNIIAANICGDHLHLLLVCEDEEMPKIVGKIKAVTARIYNIENGITVPAVGGSSRRSCSYATTTTRGLVPLSKEVPLSEYRDSSENSVSTLESDSSEKGKKKKKYNSLWTQKFGKSKITDDEYLNNAINYIRNNRKKHELPENKKLITIFDEMCCTKEHAFRKEYNGGFDVVIGNPPYVNIANIQNKNERKFYQNSYQTVKNKSDLYSIFTEFGFRVLKKEGFLSFIFSNSWLGTDSFSRFREFLIEKTEIKELIKLPAGVFKDAIVTTVIISFKKNKIFNNKITLKEYDNCQFRKLNHTLDYSRIKSLNNYTFSFEPEIKFNINTIKLGDIAKFSLGIKTSDDKRFILKEKINDDCYPMLRGRNISKYYYDKPTEWIWYKPKLMMEKVGAGPRKLEYFRRKEKILFQGICGGSIKATLDINKHLTNDKIHVLYELDDNYNFIFILCIVNSKFIDKWLNSNFNKLLEIKINQLQQFPIPKVNLIQQQPFVEKADKMLELNKELQNRKTKYIDLLKANLDCKTSKNNKNNTNCIANNEGANPFVIKSCGKNNDRVNPVVIESESSLKITKKIDLFYEHDFKTFLAELKKQKIKLSLSEQAEWKDFFDENKANINNLQNEINKTDKEIDQMVYKLYELTDEEIEIVEKNI